VIGVAPDSLDRMGELRRRHRQIPQQSAVVAVELNDSLLGKPDRPDALVAELAAKDVTLLD